MLYKKCDINLSIRSWITGICFSSWYQMDFLAYWFDKDFDIFSFKVIRTANEFDSLS